MEFDDGPEIPLLGGDVTEGLVRIGATVRRPRGTASDRVRHLLGALEHVGFDGAPRHLGVDAQGRDVLTFEPGEVAPRPWPAWVADDDRIASVARLVRRYDDAVAPFGVPEWTIVEPPPMPDAAPPSIAPVSIAPAPELIGHMDITPENVVFRRGEAAVLIDFDLARAVSRAEEVANLLLWWAPLMPPADREEAVRDVDALARSRVLLDAYGLDAVSRSILLPLSITMAARSWHSMRWRAENLGGGWKRMWDGGTGDRILGRREWLETNAAALHEAFTH